MSKSVMHSVSPQQCERIARGEQTILLSKTAPKLERPFKCYMYMTKRKEKLIGVIHKGDDIYGTTYDEETPLFIKTYAGSSLVATSLYGKESKVIGEFVCDRIEEYGYEEHMGYPTPAFDGDDSFCDCGAGYWITLDELRETCLTYDELLVYGKGKTLYGWHISDLVIYDTSKELGEFKRWCKEYCENSNCSDCGFNMDKWGVNFADGGCFVGGLLSITRPFQSWGYVEEV